MGRPVTADAAGGDSTTEGGQSWRMLWFSGIEGRSSKMNGQRRVSRYAYTPAVIKINGANHRAIEVMRFRAAGSDEPSAVFASRADCGASLTCLPSVPVSGNSLRNGLVGFCP